MSDNTGIEWADATWNPVIGCTKVSAGCDNCYAIKTATRMQANPNPKISAAYAGTAAAGEWTDQVNLLSDRLTIPLAWTKPRKVFVNSQSDLFHRNVPDRFIAEVFAVMALAGQHTFQLLTKRHGRMRSLLSSVPFQNMVALHVEMRLSLRSTYEHVWPLPNVWLGVSVEDQATANVRIPALLDTPAAIRWLSMEPLLARVDLRRIERNAWTPARTVLEPVLDRDTGDVLVPAIDWVVVGGESGPKARPMHPAWASELRDVCNAAKVPFLFKQWGEWSPMAPLDKDGRYDFTGAHTLSILGTLYDPHDLAYGPPSGPRYGEALHENYEAGRKGLGGIRLTNMYRVGKKAAGRELEHDGTTWDQYPATERTPA